MDLRFKPTTLSKRALGKNAGFTLLEMIGVMAVMAILAGALAPSIFQMMEDAYETAEEQNLEMIADRLRQVIRVEKRIPSLSTSDWTGAVADYASVAPQSILLNEKSFNRRLYADPMFFTTSNQNFAGYTQSTGLATRPNSPRLMLVSDLSGAVSANLNTHTRFSDVWDQTADALIVESNQIKIQRINLAAEFVEVVLANANAGQAGYVLDGSSEASVAAAVGAVDGNRTVFAIVGSGLGLNAAPYPGGTTQRQVLLSESGTYRYQLDGGVWSWVN